MLRALALRLTGVAAEIVVIGLLLWLPWYSPPAFAVLTTVLALFVGYAFESSRLPYEMSYYYDRPTALSRFVAGFSMGLEVVARALLAGIATLFVFLGTSMSRILGAIVAFAIVVIAGSWLIRLVGAATRLRAERWGYFRLSVVLGIAFSAIAAVFKQNQQIEQALWKMLEGLGRRQTSADFAETIHEAKNQLDLAMAALLKWFFGKDVGTVLSYLISFDTLQGFALAVYAVLLVELGRWFAAREGA